MQSEEFAKTCRELHGLTKGQRKRLRIRQMKEQLVLAQQELIRMRNNFSELPNQVPYKGFDWNVQPEEVEFVAQNQIAMVVDVSAHVEGLNKNKQYLSCFEPEGERDICNVAKLAERSLELQCDCGLPIGDLNCCVFQDEEFQFLFQGGHNDPLVSLIWNSLESIVSSYSILRTLNSDDPIFALERLSFSYKVKRSAAYRFVMAFDDSELLDFYTDEFVSSEERLAILTPVINVRAIMGHTDPILNPQGITASRLSLDLYNRRAEVFSNINPYTTIKQYVTNIVEYMWSKVSQFLSFLSDSAIQTLQTSFKAATKYMCESLFQGLEDLKICLQDNKSRIIIASVALFAFWVTIRLMKILAENIADSIFNCAVSGLNSTCAFVAQGEPDHMSLLMTLGVAIIGLTATDFNKVKKVGANITALMRGGSVATNAFKMMLVIMPATLKMAFTYKFGTPEQRLEVEIQNWQSVSSSLCALGKNQTMLGSKEYAAKISDLLTEGGSLIRKITSGVKPTVKQNMMMTYTKMVNIHTNLVTKKYNSGDRNIPFAFHFAGPPGIGKTTTIKDMLVQACGMEREMMYSRDVSDEFYSGYLDHPAIIMDEFLLGTPDDNYKLVMSYLTLVSSGEWRPNFASVDDPNVGIKGSSCKPKIVITMNNTPYDRIDPKIDDAFQRRRRFVIRAHRSTCYREEEHNKGNVDISSYSDQECVDRVWMKFDILPSMHAVNPKPILKNLTYAQLVDFVRVQYESHQTKVKRMAEGMNQSIMDEKTPEEIMDEVLRSTFAIPDKPMSITEALSSFIPVSLFGQGPLVDEEETKEDLRANYAETVEREVKTYGFVSTWISIPQVQNSFSRLCSHVSSFSTRTKMASVAVLITLLSAAVSFVTKEEMVVDTYCGQSDKRQKHSKSKKTVKVWRVKKADNITAQGPLIEPVKIFLNGLGVFAIPVGGNWFLTYNHGLDIDNSSEESIVQLHVKGRVFDCPLSNCDIFSLEEDDLLMVRMKDGRVPLFKNIVKRFICESEIDFVNNCQIMLETPKRVFSSVAVARKNLAYTAGKKRIELDSSVTYPAATEVGDCGIPIKIVSGGLANKYLGIHVAGTGASALEPRGVATFVTQETLYSIMSPEVLAQGPLPSLSDCISYIGLNTTDKVESKLKRGFVEICSGDCSSAEPCDYCSSLEEEEPANLNKVYEEKVPYNLRLSLPVNTKFSKSCLDPYLSKPSEKQPAIMSINDPRSRGICPVRKSIEELYDTQSPTMDLLVIKRIKQELLDKYSKKLNWVVGKRQLTFEEACAGVPKYLNSITTKTHPGIPMCYMSKGKGKTDFVWFDEKGSLQYTPVFRELVDRKIVEMESYKGGEIKSRLAAFLKDDLLKKPKIDAVKTRMTFANDMVALVAFRMKFGALIAAFQNSQIETGFAIGLNQYSEDMDLIYSELAKISKGITAGDFGDYDKNYIAEVQLACYEIFCELAIMFLGVDRASCEYFKEHELNSPFQILDILCKVKCSNKSGCLLTTIINCMVNVFYQMYCHYHEYPNLPYEEHVYSWVLGDDHLVARSDQAFISPVRLGEIMTSIGQKYTSAFKDIPLKDEYDSFEDTTFLGAIPRISENGKWTGALRKSTLEETIHWTRDEDLSLDAKTQQMLDCCSQWDKEYFETYVADLKQAYCKAGKVWGLNDNYYSLHYCVAARTAASGCDFQNFYAQGPSCTKCDSVDPCENNDWNCFCCTTQKGVIACPVCGLECTFSKYCSDFHAQGPMDTPAQGFTQVVTSEEQAPSKESGNLNESIAGLAIGAVPVEMPYATETLVRRITFDWASTSNAGDIIQSWQVPFGILNLTNLNNPQNVGFMNYTFSQPQFEGTFQVNGTPVQQGALCIFFVPLFNATQVIPTINNWTTLDHIILTPNGNTTRTIKIPFRFWKTYLNNRLGFTSPTVETMGTLFVGVLSPLNTSSLPSTASVSMYGKFLSKFWIPRPRTLTGQGPLFDFNVTNTRTGDIVGDVPIQGNSRSTVSNETDEQVSLLPFDDLPVNGGAVPIYQQFSSMSKSVGAQPGNALQLHQAMMHRQPHQLCFPEITLVSDLCARRGYYNTYTLSTTDAANTEIISIPLNSVFSLPTAGNSNVVPANIAVLNQFQRWRCNIALDLFACKTVFHTTRLEVVTAYGYNGALTALDWNSFPSRIVEFTDQNQWATTIIPYAASTEYLRTYDGPISNSNPDYTLGQVSVFVANPLKVSGTVVSSSIQILVFLRFEDVEVYEPRSNLWVSLDQYSLPVLVGQGPMESAASISSMGGNGGDTTVSVERNEGDEEHPPEIPTIAVNPVVNSKPCDLDIGSKFEYKCRDIMELGRRHYNVPLAIIPGYTTSTIKSALDGGSGYSGTIIYDFISFNVKPMHPIVNLFQAWSGHLSFRIFAYTSSSTGNNMAGPMKVSHVPNSRVPASQQLTTGPPPAVQFGAVVTANTTIFDSLVLAPSVAVIGQTGSGTQPLWNPNTYIYKYPQNINSNATEFFYPVSNNCWMAEISVPFNTNSNYLPTSTSVAIQDKDQYNGRLVIQLPEFANYDIAVYQAFGDDFKLHAYAPTTQMYADGYRINTFSGPITAPPANSMIGQNAW